MICKFCAQFLRILRNMSARIFYGTIVCDTGVYYLENIGLLVHLSLELLFIQLTFSLRSYLPTTGSSNGVVWRMFIVYICERKLTTSGILCNFNHCKWKGSKISKIFALSVPFGKFSSILHRTPNSAQGLPILCKILRVQNHRILTSLIIGALHHTIKIWYVQFARILLY